MKVKTICMDTQVVFYRMGDYYGNVTAGNRHTEESGDESIESEYHCESFAVSGKSF